LEQLLPGLAMARLRIPCVQVLADFFQECNSDGLTAQREHAPGKIEEVKNIEVLSACEGFADAVLERRFFIWPGSFACKNYLGYLPLPRFVQCAFDIGESYRPVLYLDGQNELSGFIQTLEVGSLTG
jgi:hypothetical protein